MRRYIFVGSVVLLVVAIIGLAIAMLSQDSFTEYDKYGEVPVPGTRTLHLPAGKIDIGFNHHNTAKYRKSYPVPRVQVGITPPPGVATPAISEAVGGETDSGHRRQLWTVQITEPGDYTITTVGEVSKFKRPGLTFGHTPPTDYSAWFEYTFYGVAAISVLGMSLSAPKKKRSPGQTEE